MPDVIRLKNYVKIPTRNKSFSRKHVFMRDQHTCQYCGNQYHPSELTVDHVHPRSKGGKYSWENVVTACKPCNTRKADRFLWETSMNLLRDPKAPSVMLLHLQNVRSVARQRTSWQKYLFYE